eukprot:TRINITY_DN703_c0_g1_i2.p1 TRINITY_DN703_c0_g1~~TRINITY_DN703_c0_g1_i2.p1  ORF type:complete len:1930 (-),score=307.00 TRINITY_DN703_c0_g1_i2:3006-8795(-)
MASIQWLGLVLLICLLPTLISAGASGLNYVTVTAISGDIAPQETTFCSGPTDEYQPFSMTCPATTLLTTAFGSRGLIKSIPRAAYGRTGAGQLTMSCPNSVPSGGSGGQCYCNCASALQTRCQGLDSCNFNVDNSITGCDPCSGYGKTLISRFNCAGYRRSLVWYVHQSTASGNPLFWTTSNAVYRVPGNNAANTGLTKILNVVNDLGFQTFYTKSWTFNNRLYLLATINDNNDARVYEFSNIPSSAVTINTNSITAGSNPGQRTAISESGPFTAIEQMPYSNDAFGVIWTSSPTVLRSWTRGSDWGLQTTWNIPTTCAGSRCFDFYRGSSVVVPTLYDSKRYVAFGGTNGRVVVVDSADVTLSQRNNPEVLPAGAGVITTMTWAQLDSVGYLVLGSSLGIIFQYDFAQRRIANIAVIPSPVAQTPSLTTLAWDQTTKSLFAAGGDNARIAAVYRVRLTDFSLDAIDFEALPQVSSQNAGGARAMWIDVPRNRLFVGADQPVSGNVISTAWDVPVNIFSFSIAVCNYACSDCGVVDPSFCGWCAGSASCELIQAINSTSCPAAVGPFTQPAACPVVNSLSRTSGSLSGGTLVNLQGANFFSNAGAASLYGCTFGGVAGTVVSVSSTQVTCRTPAGALGTVTVALTFRSSAVAVSQPLQYQYIDCAALDCDTCFTAGNGDCVWCHQAGGCRGAASCTGPFSTATCPVATSVSNAISTTGFVNNFTISATQLNSTAQYRCNVNGLTSTGTLVNANTAVRCQRPSGVLASRNAPFLEIFDGAGWKRFTQPRSTDPLLEIYDCLSIGACFSCISNHPDCAFCSGGQCSYDTGTCSQDSTSCPRITAASPSRVHYSADSGASIALTISAANSVDASSFRCIWKFANGSTFANVSAIAPLTQTAATCVVPSVRLSVPSVTVEIWAGAIPHTNPFSITVYDCSAGTRCSICENSARPKCTWCNSLLTCEATSALPGGSCPQGNTAVCPSISASPALEPLSGGRNISVVPTTIPATTTNAFCAFRGTDLTVDVAATWNGAAFICVAPRSSTSQIATLALIISGTDYAAPVDFEYFDCAFASSAVPRTCSDCVARSGCGWCGGSCAAQLGGCVQPLSQCPVITAISPAYVDASTSETIEISTNPLPPAEYSYDCIFGSQRYNAAPSPTGLRCQTPTLPTAAFVSVQIATRTNFLGLWSTDVVAPQLEFYKCADSARQCGPSCFSSSPYCGYCLETGQCSGRIACQRFVAVSDTGLPIEKVWFNSTDSCPSVAQYGPTFMQAALPNRPIIRESVSFTLANVELPVVNMTGKRDVGLSRFGCQFGADSVAVSTFDAATKTFTCQAPVLRDQGFYSLAVTYQGNRINSEGSARLQVQDCFSIPACGLCLLQPNCGWCRGSVRCMTKAWCDAEPITEFGQVCPTVTRVTPATSVIDQTTDATITGGPFVNSSLLVVKMEYTSKNRTINLATRWVSPSELVATILPSVDSYEGEVRLSVWMNETQYVPSDLAFIYLAPSAIIGGVQPAAIGGIVAAAVIVILILIGALIFMRSRKVGFFSQFRLKEPDYALVAFSTMLQPQWKAPKDNWEILAIKLLAKDHGFVFSIMATTPPTEQDKISRALCHVYEWHKKSVEYGVLFVTDEVSRNLEENTIFRNNSMASKWFKFYCKIIGIKYLFDHLARFIYELNKISEEKGQASEDTTGGKSLLSLEMEVDPNKFGNDAFTDSEANVYQLILACQKVFTAFRTSIDKIPPEFKEIFSSMRESIVNKFKSDDAVLKAVGGFFFLRFACPAITAPHAYGLLENPPNESCQRQLVLIGKVIQNLANMTMPGAKEQFMQQLSDFFSRNIPKMRQFYNDLLSANFANAESTEIVATPDIVRVNGLGFIMEHIHLQQAKLKSHFEIEADSDDRLRELNDTLKELLEVYPKKPRKATEKDDKAAE